MDNGINATAVLAMMRRSAASFKAAVEGGVGSTALLTRAGFSASSLSAAVASSSTIITTTAAASLTSTTANHVSTAAQQQYLAINSTTRPAASTVVNSSQMFLTNPNSSSSSSSTGISNATDIITSAVNVITSTASTIVETLFSPSSSLALSSSSSASSLFSPTSTVVAAAAASTNSNYSSPTSSLITTTEPSLSSTYSLFSTSKNNIITDSTTTAASSTTEEPLTFFFSPLLSTTNAPSSGTTADVVVAASTDRALTTVQQILSTLLDVNSSSSTTSTTATRLTSRLLTVGVRTGVSAVQPQRDLASSSLSPSTSSMKPLFVYETVSTENSTTMPFNNADLFNNEDFLYRYNPFNWQQDQFENFALILVIAGLLVFGMLCALIGFCFGCWSERRRRKYEQSTLTFESTGSSGRHQVIHFGEQPPYYDGHSNVTTRSAKGPISMVPPRNSSNSEEPGCQMTSSTSNITGNIIHASLGPDTSLLPNTSLRQSSISHHNHSHQSRQVGDLAVAEEHI